MPPLKLASRRGKNPDGQMPLVEHIRELRNRLLKVLIGVVAGLVLGWVLYKPIFEFLREPYCQATGRGDCKLYVFGVLESFTFRLKIAFIVSMVVSSPVWVYQLWAFVTPGLRAGERRYTLGFVGLGVPFFLGGVALAYVTISKGLAFFVGLLSSGLELNLKASQYLTFLVVVMLVFGISFELPLLATMLNFAGVLSYERLRAWRRWIVFGICVFAAVATPTQDPFTMLALAVPMAVLMEVATLIAKFHDRRKARREANSAYAQLGDDETSPLDLDEATPRDTDDTDNTDDSSHRDSETQ